MGGEYLPFLQYLFIHIRTSPNFLNLYTNVHAFDLLLVTGPFGLFLTEDKLPIQVTRCYWSVDEESPQQGLHTE